MDKCWLVYKGLRSQKVNNACVSVIYKRNIFQLVPWVIMLSAPSAVHGGKDERQGEEN